jgi:uncharacterized LabA/DUF88 family protein
MPDPEVVKLASDPNARVLVAVDGQNLYNSARRLFGHPLCHPNLLALWLAGPRTTNRVACRFYTGEPDRNVPGEARRLRNLDRRLAAMRTVGVTTVTRKLRYHWDWGHRGKLPPPTEDADPIDVTLAPWQRPQEKGIDMVLALDVVEFILTEVCDVAIIVSLDRDLAEIPLALRNLRRFRSRPFRVEAAVPVPGGLTKPKTLTGFDYTHQITPDVFRLIRDSTDYTVGDDVWNPPVIPSALPNATRNPESGSS